MKICSKCTNKYECYGQRNSLCRECKKVYDREYHKKRTKEAKENKKKKQNERIIENRKKLYNFYSVNSCSECVEKRVACLQLDHIDPNNKYKAISNMMSYSWKRIEEEIKKCRVLCANCHAVHTAEQQNYYDW